MDLIRTSKVNDTSNPAVKRKKWLEITKKYNEANGTSYTKIQLDNKSKNYKKSLSKENSKLKTSYKKTGTYLQIFSK